MNKEIIDKTIAALRHNHFEAFFAHNTAEASAIFFRDIFPDYRWRLFPGAIPKR